MAAIDFSHSKPEGNAAAARSVLAVLKQCSLVKDLARGKQTHSFALELGLLSNRYVLSALINMYAKCGRMEEAEELFSNHYPQLDVACWNCLIQGYLDSGCSDLALELVDRMEECLPDARTYVSAITACATLAGKSRKVGASRNVEEWLEKGQEFHSRAVISRRCNIYLENSLIDLYSKCGCLLQAKSVFDSMVKHNIVSWNSLLQGCVENQENELAVDLFDRIHQEADEVCVPDERTYVAVLTACATLAARSGGDQITRWLAKGSQIHSQADKNSACCGNMFVQTSLVNFYSKCGMMVSAQRIFDGMRLRDGVAWNALLQGYVESGEELIALKVFDSMNRSTSDARTYVAALTACGALAVNKIGDDLRWLEEKGEEIHSLAVRSSCCDVLVETALVNLYAKCGKMTLAREVFDRMVDPDLVAWNSLLRGYAENGENEQALELYFQGSSSEVDARTSAVALKACAALGRKNKQSSSLPWLQKGEAIHFQALRTSSWDVVVETALISMYASCGSVCQAYQVFDGMIQPDAAAWNCLIQAHVDDEQKEAAVKMILKMEVSPDSSTFVTAIAACESIERGRWLVCEIFRGGFEQNHLVAVCLVDFFGRSGRMKAAKLMFDCIPSADVGAWNSLLNGFSQHGEIANLIEQFGVMIDQGCLPDEMTFTSVLSACSHAGMAELGELCFNAMKFRYGVLPDAVHYTCLADLFERADFVEEALRIAKSMPCEADGVTWTAIQKNTLLDLFSGIRRNVSFSQEFLLSLRTNVNVSEITA